MNAMICEQPVRIDRLFDDPDAMRELVAEHEPYWPVMRYFANPAEETAQNGGKSVDAGREAAKQTRVADETRTSTRLARGCCRADGVPARSRRAPRGRRGTRTPR